MHRSVDMFEKFFTKMYNNNNEKSKKIKTYENYTLNAMQNSVINNIINSESSIHIIYGPPGTGKTHTLIEMIKIFYEEKRNTKILLTAPSNYASDLLCLRLLDYCQKTNLKMIRLNPPHRDPKDLLSNDIIKFC